MICPVLLEWETMMAVMLNLIYFDIHWEMQFLRKCNHNKRSISVLVVLSNFLFNNLFSHLYLSIKPEVWMCISTSSNIGSGQKDVIACTIRTSWMLLKYTESHSSHTLRKRVLKSKRWLIDQLIGRMSKTFTCSSSNVKYSLFFCFLCFGCLAVQKKRSILKQNQPVVQ